MKEFVHESVLLNEAVDALNIKPDGIYVDGTTGGGGHSEKIAKKLGSGRLICIDKDEDALRAAKERLSGFNCITFVHDDFKNLEGVLKSLGVDKIDGLIVDLGVSSYQLDEKTRGFSYMEEEAPLDMRMDKTAAFSAEDIVNTYPEEELKRIFKEYGEEKFSGRIASGIVKARGNNPIKTAGDLNRIIEKCVPKHNPGGHPSKRVFMALRIEVNGELDGLYDFFCSLPDLMNDKGRISVISFHSLEDRAVKRAFKDLFDPCICPKDFPVCTCGRKSKGVQIVKKPILPSSDEMAKNSRSKSAKLRIFEKREIAE